MTASIHDVLGWWALAIIVIVLIMVWVVRGNR